MNLRTMNILKSFKLFATRSNSFTYVQIAWFSENDFKPVALWPKKPKAKQPVTQYFVDKFHVETVGGKGGDGCISLLTLWANEKAGPDGGDGGNGGHVIFKTSSNVTDFSNLRKRIQGANGERGFNKDCTGKSGNHEYVKVPLGTVIKNEQGVVIGDLREENTLFIAARGGAGGRGNHYFASDTIQTPEVAEMGAEGEIRRYILELRVMAHIGLIGMPNVGKSTLLRAISRARPEVAPYAFTTLKPHIGIINYSDYEQIAVADLPGLVEGSHKNEGLGIEFLKHAERCRGIMFIIDLSQDDPIWQYNVLRDEISKFCEEINSRPFVIVGNKMDLEKAQNNLEEFQSKVNHPVIPISGKTGKNLKKLLNEIRVIYDTYLTNNSNDGDSEIT